MLCSRHFAAWHALTNAARDDQPELALVKQRIALLNAMLTSADIEPGHLFGQLANVLPPPRQPVLRAGAAPVERTNEQRLEAGAALLHEPASMGHCVAWSTFAAASLPKFALEMGPVTFFDADWCIPNALGLPGKVFSYRGELARVIANDVRATPNPNAGPHHEVLTGIDLGRRSPYGALQVDHAPLWQPLTAATAGRSLVVFRLISAGRTEGTGKGPGKVVFLPPVSIPLPVHLPSPPVKGRLQRTGAAR